MNQLYKSSKLKNVTYIIDYLNLISDFREVKYKEKNIEWKSVKHAFKEQDTNDFFKIFFTNYINYVNIDKNSKFLFIMKKIYNYDYILMNILKDYQMYNIQFIIIKDKYNELIIDKNKDDYLCQYYLYKFKKMTNCILISNDKYRDRNEYIEKFDFDINIIVLEYNKRNFFQIKTNKQNANQIKNQIINRKCIPKHKLKFVMNQTEIKTQKC